jgi:peptide chain release factor 1
MSDQTELLTLREELERLEGQFRQINDELSGESIDPKKRASLSRESSKLERLISIKQQIHHAATAKAEAISLAEVNDHELKELCEQEVAELAEQILALNQELEDLLFPPDPRDQGAAFLEIRAGAGGQEASLFVGDLLKLYNNYALLKNWEFSINSLATTDVGGYREVIAYIKGKNAYKFLKHESGVHRVQRVPKTETQGRIHTSTVTVAVMPEADDVDIQINPADLRVDVYRASGAGGQHVNTTDSAVRITHIPTGVAVSCQQERSQHKNKERALKELRSRILQAELEKVEKLQTAARKKQIGSGDRSEKIRTYNYPQNRITDHRIGLTLKKLDIVMQGDIDEIIQPLIQAERELRLAEAHL